LKVNNKKWRLKASIFYYVLIYLLKVLILLKNNEIMFNTKNTELIDKVADIPLKNRFFL